ncbi:NAD(P)/FAD-dependent oxidoreductase [Krasilnikovia sp. MM14-A1259]|uniref:NAD(P)/FAD-dependent oxidoreductase n=1 Tax=Krasilnikovia sp. MM14-A1259 TaxID=3373539 RepID=UPI00380AA933
MNVAGHWDVVVAGGRIAGAATAWALAPYAERILVVDASRADTFWAQQSTWDRAGNLEWDALGLLDTVLACGAPRTFGHDFRTGNEVVEHHYPQGDDYGFRMSVPREVLDPALMQTAESRGNVTVVRPARVRDIVRTNGRVTGATVRTADGDQPVTSDLLVLADGRRSRNATDLGAQPYRTVRSPWAAMLAYYEDLPLPTDRAYFSMGGASILIATPCGKNQWCIASDVHFEVHGSTGEHPAGAYTRLVHEEPLLGPAVAQGRRTTPIAGAGRLRMLRRPMTGPGWALVGDSGYHLDPVTAQGTRAALTTTRLLRDRVAAHGQIAGLDLDGLTGERDAALDEAWDETEQICRA